MKITLLILTILLSINLKAQDWYNQISGQVYLIEKINKHESWDSIYNFAYNKLKIHKETLDDILESIVFKNQKVGQSVVDEFFHNICDSVYSNFPFRSSGHLYKGLYYNPSPEPTEFEITLSSIYGKNLNWEFAKLLQLDLEILLPQLQKYLSNDAMTRLCIRPDDSGDIPFCLSVSDMAMEIIEVKTYCDFFDNASHSAMLFSNLDTIKRNKIIKSVAEWYYETQFLAKKESIVYFLDKFTDWGHSYTYTCNNLMFFLVTQC